MFMTYIDGRNTAPGPTRAVPFVGDAPRSATMRGMTDESSRRNKKKRVEGMGRGEFVLCVKARTIRACLFFSALQRCVLAYVRRSLALSLVVYRPKHAALLSIDCFRP